MNKRFSRNACMMVAIGALLITDMCDLVDGGPIERIFAKKDLPNGPAFGFYRTVWHEWPDAHGHVYYEPELAEGIPYESVPDGGPALYPPDETPSSDYPSDDPSPPPPSQEPPPGLEEPMAPADDPSPLPPAESPTAPADTPGQPADESPAAPSDSPVIPPGFEDSGDKPDGQLPTPQGQGTLTLPPPSYELLQPVVDEAETPTNATTGSQRYRARRNASMASDIHSQPMNGHARERATFDVRKESRIHGEVNGTGLNRLETTPLPNFPPLESSGSARATFEPESASDATSTTTLNPLRANPSARPLAPATQPPTLRSYSSAKQVQFTADVNTTNMPKRRPRVAESSDQGRSLGTPQSQRRSKFVNPLRAESSEADATGRFQPNPLRAANGR